MVLITSLGAQPLGMTTYFNCVAVGYLVICGVFPRSSAKSFISTCVGAAVCAPLLKADQTLWFQQRREAYRQPQVLRGLPSHLALQDACVRGG